MATEEPFTVSGASRERSVVLTYVALLAVAAAAWVGVLRAPMSAGDMAGMRMMMAPTVRDALEYVVAWTVMMAAMMLPSAAPMIALFAATQRGARPVTRAVAVGVFAVTYVALWAATGLPIYAASLALMAVGPGTLASVTAGVLIVAGLFQLSPLKQVCLRHCRTPLGFLLSHWRGPLAMGWSHAWYCIGCCWALMVVLVVAGAMGLRWVLLIAALVAAEKLLPGGEWIARVTGAALIVLGVLVAAEPQLTTALRAME